MPDFLLFGELFSRFNIVDELGHLVGIQTNDVFLLDSGHIHHRGRIFLDHFFLMEISEKGIQRRQLSGFAFLMIPIDLGVLFIIGQEGEIFLNIHRLDIVQNGYRQSPKILVTEIRIRRLQEIKKGAQVVRIIASGIGCLFYLHGAEEILRKGR